MGLISRPRKSSGEGNGNLFQYSCLRNPMDRGAWQGQGGCNPWGCKKIRHDFLTKQPQQLPLLLLLTLYACGAQLVLNAYSFLLQQKETSHFFLFSLIQLCSWPHRDAVFLFCFVFYSCSDTNLFQTDNWQAKLITSQNEMVPVL